MYERSSIPMLIMLEGERPTFDKIKDMKNLRYVLGPQDLTFSAHVAIPGRGLSRGMIDCVPDEDDVFSDRWLGEVMDVIEFVEDLVRERCSPVFRT